MTVTITMTAITTIMATTAMPPTSCQNTHVLIEITINHKKYTFNTTYQILLSNNKKIIVDKLFVCF